MEIPAFIPRPDLLEQLVRENPESPSIPCSVDLPLQCAELLDAGQRLVLRTGPSVSVQVSHELDHHYGQCPVLCVLSRPHRRCYIFFCRCGGRWATRRRTARPTLGSRCASSPSGTARTTTGGALPPDAVRRLQPAVTRAAWHAACIESRRCLRVSWLGSDSATLPRLRTEDVAQASGNSRRPWSRGCICCCGQQASRPLHWRALLQ